MGVRSHIGVQNVQKILFGADKGRSHKTSRSYNRRSLIAGTTVQVNNKSKFENETEKLQEQKCSLSILIFPSLK